MILVMLACGPLSLTAQAAAANAAQQHETDSSQQSRSSELSYQSTAGDAFNKTWERTDQLVASGQVNRTWMWGPQPNSGEISEPYADSPGGHRTVEYFDKSRMEITNPNGDSNSIWYVTNGLLAEELVTGRMQTGNSSFEQHSPAEINVAGDANDPNGPTYATFNPLMGYGAIPNGWNITQVLERSGNVTVDSSLSSYNVSAMDVGSPTKHNVASVFWEFMNSSGPVYQSGQQLNDKLFQNPFYATGYPLTEAYWSHVLVGGVSKLVLVQVFERRVLTYTPDNPTGWQVEAGNVGQHYYAWRYQNANQTVTQMINAHDGGTVAFKDQLTINFAPGALSQNTTITIRPIAQDLIPTLDSGMSVAGTGYDIDLGGASLTSPASIQLSYQENAELQSVRGGSTVFLMSMTSDGLWKPIAGTIDAATNRINADLPYIKDLLPTRIDADAWIQNALNLDFQKIVNERVALQACNTGGTTVSVTNEPSSTIWGCLKSDATSPATVSVFNRMAFALNVDSDSSNSNQVPNQLYLAPGDSHDFPIDTTKGDSPIRLIPSYSEKAFLVYVAQLYLSAIPVAGDAADILSDPLKRESLAALIAPGLENYGGRLWQKAQAEDWTGCATILAEMYLDHNVFAAVSKVLQDHGIKEVAIAWLQFGIQVLSGVVGLVGTLVAIIQSGLSQSFAEVVGSFSSPQVVFSWTPAGVPPTIPSNVTATALDSGHVRVTWQDNSNNESDFLVGNGDTDVKVGANTTSYTWGGLQPNTYMCFDVLAENSFGSSDWTSYACTTTPSATSVVTVSVSATTGWQSTGVSLQDGESFSISYVSGTWTVDYNQFPYVGPSGYDAETDAEIDQSCKDYDLPYATLLGEVSGGSPFAVGTGGTGTADANGVLYLRIHDDDACLGDNDGSVIMTITTGGQTSVEQSASLPETSTSRFRMVKRITIPK